MNERHATLKKARKLATIGTIIMLIMPFVFGSSMSLFTTGTFSMAYVPTTYFVLTLILWASAMLLSHTNRPNIVLFVIYGVVFTFTLMVGTLYGTSGILVGTSMLGILISMFDTSFLIAAVCFMTASLCFVFDSRLPRNYKQTA